MIKVYQAQLSSAQLISAWDYNLRLSSRVSMIFGVSIKILAENFSVNGQKCESVFYKIGNSFLRKIWKDQPAFLEARRSGLKFPK